MYFVPEFIEFVAVPGCNKSEDFPQISPIVADYHLAIALPLTHRTISVEQRPLQCSVISFNC